MRSHVTILPLLILTAQLTCAQEPTPTPPEGTQVPLLNGDFSSPKVPDDQLYTPNARADNWTFDIIEDSRGMVGVHCMAWREGRPQFFFWANPNGSISQTVDAKSFTISNASDILKLFYRYGGQGGGEYQVVATLLVDAKPVATATHDVAAPKGVDTLSNVLAYPIKKEDVGKSVGVKFAYTSQGSQFIQAALTNVALTVSSPDVAK